VSLGPGPHMAVVRRMLMEGLDRTAAGALLTDILDLAGNLGGYPVPQANVRTYSGLGLQSAGAALWLVSMSAAGTLSR
jgi:hypothetical protein